MLGWVGTEHRRYRFASGEGVENEGDRFGVNVDSGLVQDFGPTLLVPVGNGGGEDKGE